MDIAAKVKEIVSDKLDVDGADIQEEQDFIMMIISHYSHNLKCIAPKPNVCINSFFHTFKAHSINGGSIKQHICLLV